MCRGSRTISLVGSDGIVRILEGCSHRITLDIIVALGWTHESICKNRYEHQGDDGTKSPSISSTCKEEKNRNKCEKNIRYRREFSCLIFLECEVEGKTDVVIDTFFIPKISSEILVL